MASSFLPAVGHGQLGRRLTAELPLATAHRREEPQLLIDVLDLAQRIVVAHGYTW
jgi:hypothetical protein